MARAIWGWKRSSWLGAMAAFCGVLALAPQAGAALRWVETVGGSSPDLFLSVDQTADGGYVALGETQSFGPGGRDIWVTRCDAEGSVLWQRAYGGSQDDFALCIRQCADGGYLVTALTKISGQYDAWILKLDASGNIIWQETLGGTGDDHFKRILVLADGGFLLCGGTESFGAGGDDAWLARLSATGSLTWLKTYGGSSQDYATSVIQSNDGGYVMAGFTMSQGIGAGDGWALKLDSTGTIIWQQVYGSSLNTESFNDVLEGADGSYYLAGYTWSFGAGWSDAWLVKVAAADGTLQWGAVYGTSLVDYVAGMILAGDGGLLLVGSTTTVADSDVWLIKVSSAGSLLWQKAINTGDTDNGASAVGSGDGGVVLVGDCYTSTSNWQGLIASVSPSGDVDPACGSAVYQTSGVTTTVTSSMQTKTSATTVASPAAVPAASSLGASAGAASASMLCSGGGSVSPAIVTQPQSQSIASGGSATLSVSASGAGPLNYQWYQGASGDTSHPMAGATSASFTTPALSATTTYWARVSNSYGSADSDAAVITVSAGSGPTIAQIKSKTSKPGSKATIIGSGFSTTKTQNTVLFGTRMATVKKAKASKLTVIIPSRKPHAGQTVNVTVTVNSAVSNAVSFQIK